MDDERADLAARRAALAGDPGHQLVTDVTRGADGRPALVIEARDAAPFVEGRALVEAQPVTRLAVGEQALRTAFAAAQRARRRYSTVTSAANRGCDPRRHSLVEHRVPVPAAVVATRLARQPLALVAGTVRVTGDGAPLAYDPVEHAHRVPAHLQLRWSWPRLPIWLTVAEQSSSTCALRLTLRTRRRVRYPLRYFDASHEALRGLAARLAG